MTITLIKPFQGNYELTQGFGENADFYSNEAFHHGWSTPGHNGLDYGLPMNTPVLAMADGTVTKVDTDDDGFGKYVKVMHQVDRESFYSLYAHLNNFGLVQVGQSIPAGFTIGFSGSTGCSTGPHLHVGLYLESQKNNGFDGAIDLLPFFRYSQAEIVTGPSISETPIIFPPSGKAVVVWSNVNIRPAPDTTTAPYGAFYKDASIDYDAIVEKEGGEKWLRFSIFGVTLFCAAFYDNDWVVNFINS